MYIFDHARRTEVLLHSNSKVKQLLSYKTMLERLTLAATAKLCRLIT